MNLERIASLLASGLKPGQVATIVGCSPGRISQLQAESQFQLILAEKEALMTEKNVEEESLSAKYSVTEHLLLNQVMEMAPASELRDITAALRVVAERQDRMKARAMPSPSGNTQVQVVQINIPAHAMQMPSIQMTNQREVTSIGDRALAPLSSGAVVNLFNSQKGDSHEHQTSTRSPEKSSSEALPSASSQNSFLSFAHDFS